MLLQQNKDLIRVWGLNLAFWEHWPGQEHPKYPQQKLEEVAVGLFYDARDEFWHSGMIDGVWRGPTSHNTSQNANHTDAQDHNSKSTSSKLNTPTYGHSTYVIRIRKHTFTHDHTQVMCGCGHSVFRACLQKKCNFASCEMSFANQTIDSWNHMDDINLEFIINTDVRQAKRVNSEWHIPNWATTGHTVYGKIPQKTQDDR